MTKYLARSAEVLNDADDFEKRLNWTLFTHEQDQMLWSESPKINWVPGDYIYPDPRPQWGYNTRVLFYGGVDGNVVRPMIEEFDDGDIYNIMRCKDCEVSWSFGSGNICWMCGENYPSTFRYYGDVKIPTSALGYDSDFETIGYSPADANYQLQMYATMDFSISIDSDPLEDFRDIWDRMNRRLEESLEQTIAASNRFQVGMDRFRGSMGIFRDEARVWWVVDPALPEPVIIHGVEMPEGWDDPAPAIPLPDVPEPRDFTNWSAGGYRPENESRRVR